MPAVYTRTGDSGATGLYGGSRVPKQSMRVEAYGSVDEANAALGQAKVQLEPGPWRERIQLIQQRLFVLAAELACDAEGISKLADKICPADIQTLEQLIDECLALTGKPKSFVVPGRDQVSAPFHLARTIVRRAERRVLSLSETEPVRSEVIKYLNRLSDAVYALARLTETWFEQRIVEKVVREVVNKYLAEINQISPSSSIGQIRKIDKLTLEVCKQLAEAAEQKASQLGIPIVFAAVDDAGNLILVHRMGDSLLGSLDIAINKAWSANAFKQSTVSLGKAAAKDLPGLAEGNQGRVVLFGGGEPVFYGEQLLGGLGVSGGTVAQDCQILDFAMKQILGEQS